MENVLQQNLTVDYWANAAAMMRTAGSFGGIIVVRSEFEAALFEQWMVRDARVLLVTCDVGAVVQRAVERGCVGIVGVVRESPPGVANLVSIDLGDAESMVLQSGAFERACVECGGREWYESVRSIAKNLRHRLHCLSVLRQENGANLAIHYDRLLPTAPELAHRMKELEALTLEEVMGLAHGREVVECMCDVIQNCSPDGMGSKLRPNEIELSRILRLGFADDDFVRTRAFWRLRSWELTSGYSLLRELRRTDPLGVFVDQSYWEREIHLYIRESASLGGLVLLQMDLDNFGQVNKLSGHAAGDQLIRRYGELVVRVLGTRGEVYRRGGDETVAVLPGYDAVRALEVAESIRTLIESELAGTTTSLPVTVSIGLVAVETGMSTFEVLELLDARQRKAKTSGKNQVITD